jgi:hypothetical protein
MSGRSRVTGVLAAVLAAGGLAGCGGSLPSQLKDPGSGGVEALRATLGSALAEHDLSRQCELFAPPLLDSEGGSVAACARSLARWRVCAVHEQPEGVCGWWADRVSRQ